jgi:hypothetical protein
MGIWILSLSVSDLSCAETIKSYVRLRNEEYGFYPYDETKMTGLEYVNDGIVYRDGKSSELARFFNFANEIVEHFPQINLSFCEFNCDNQHMRKYRSRSGKLQPIKERILEFHTERESNFKCMRSALISLIDEVGIEIDKQEYSTKTNIIAISYDELTEQVKMESILDSVASLLPEIEIICIKANDECYETPYESFCIITGGSYAWKILDYDMNQNMIEIYDPLKDNNDYQKHKRFHVVKNIKD